VQALGNFLFVLAAIPAVLSVLVYMRVPWWRSGTGQHLMSYMAVIAAVMLLGCVRLIIGRNEFFEALRTTVFAGVPVVMWWRLILLIQEQRGDRRSRSGDAEDGNVEP
jgi:hypothetical protein